MTNKESFSVGVITGGMSPERDVSIHTGENVYQALLKSPHNPTKINIDQPEDLLRCKSSDVEVIFNCLHGGIGEDGTAQTLFEILKIPYTGTGPLGSALAMNKILSKKVLQESSLNIASYLELPEDKDDIELFVKNVKNEFGFPTVVKPVHTGSSVGIEIVNSEKQLSDYLNRATTKFGEVFVEQYVAGKDVTAGILEINNKITALPLIELQVKTEPFYNYRAKYTPGETEFIVPANISRQSEKKIKQMAVSAHKAINCRGYSRVDFRLDIEHGKSPYILEINTLPGMTDTSDLPLAAQEMGLSYLDLVNTMLRSGRKRFKNWFKLTKN